LWRIFKHLHYSSQGIDCDTRLIFQAARIFSAYIPLW
jgi:hypothetical protein